MQRHLYKCFQLPGYTSFLQDTYVSLVDKTDPRIPTKPEDPRIPTKPEDYWIYTFKTKAPMGLYVEGGLSLLSSVLM